MDSKEKICILDEWVQAWITEVLPGVVKESTLLMYKKTMERHILPVLGKIRLEELSSEVIQGWVEKLRQEIVYGTINGYMTEGTVRNTLSVLSGCMRDAQKYGLISENPCLKPAWSISCRNLNEHRDIWLGEEQMRCLEPLMMQYRSAEGYPLGIGFQLVLYTGLFMSEAAALRWKDIDFTIKVLSVHYFVAAEKRPEEDGGGNVYYLEKVNGRREREVPVPDDFCQKLASIKERFQKGEEDFVLENSGSGPVGLDRMRAALLRSGRKAGLGRVTPQMLRDTFAMRAVHAGATSDMIAELMGFASPQQVVRRYMPQNTVDKRELVNRMYTH